MGGYQAFWATCKELLAKAGSSEEARLPIKSQSALSAAPRSGASCNGDPHGRWYGSSSSREDCWCVAVHRRCSSS